MGAVGVVYNDKEVYGIVGFRYATIMQVSLILVYNKVAS